MDLAAQFLGVGIETYCPIHKRWRKLPKHIAHKTGRTRELVETAVLRGYLFLSAQDQEALAAVYSNKRVFGFVSNNDRICLASPKDISDMQAIEARVKSGLLSARQATQMIQDVAAKIDMSGYKGQRVRMLAGAFKGLDFLVESIFNSTEELLLASGGFGLKVKAKDVELT